MSFGVEQLYYTWAPRGIEGVNRFQIAAMSPGLRSRAMAGVLPAVRRICRYDRPRGRDPYLPTSYGWLDYREYRIAFSRVALPAIRGKTGNFAAHVLVGEPRDLPEGRLGSLFGSPFWWTGHAEAELDEIAAGRRDFSLSVLDPDAIESGQETAEPEPIDAAMTLIECLFELEDRDRLAVIAEADTFGEALRLVARNVPESLQGLSVSTYEGTPTFPFRVVGTRTPSGRQRVCELAPTGDEGQGLEVAARLMATDRDAHRLRAACRHVRATEPNERRRQYWLTATGLVSLVVDPGAELQHQSALLSTADAAAYLASQPMGLARLVGAMPESATIRRAVRQAATLMPSRERATLHAALVEQYSDGRRLTGCAQAAELIVDRDARRAFVETVTDIAVRSPQCAATLELNDATLILRAARDRDLAEDDRIELMRAVAHHASELADERSIPDADISVMLRQLMLEDADGDILAELVRKRPAVMLGVRLNPDERKRCLTILHLMDVDGLRSALPVLLLCVLEPASLDVVRNLLGRLPLMVAAECLVRAQRGGPASEELDVMRTSYAALLIEGGSADGASRGTLFDRALDVIDGDSSADLARAQQILRAMRATRLRHPMDLAFRARDITDRRLRRALISAVVDRAVSQVEHGSDVERIWQGVLEACPGMTEPQAVQALLRTTSRQRGGWPSAIVLGWIARAVLPVHPKLVTPRGRLKDEVSESVAKEIAVGIPGWCFDELDPIMADCERAGRTWWRSLAAHNRKAARTADHR